MGRAAVVIRRVALVQNFYVIAYLNFKRAFYDKVALLTLVRGQFYRTGLSFFAVHGTNEQRLCYSVFKSRSKVIINHSVGLFYLLPLAVSHDGISRELRTRTLYYIRYVYAENLRATIQKSKVQIHFAAFAGEILVYGNAYFVSDFVNV